MSHANGESGSMAIVLIVAALKHLHPRGAAAGRTALQDPAPTGIKQQIDH
jgi:hypothetical protein